MEIDVDKDFPAWYENYSEGLPLFADEWREKLDGLLDYNSIMREPVALAAAFATGHQYLMQDISQTMIDHMDGATAPRDDTLRIAAKTIHDIVMNNLVISENPWDSQIQCAVCAVLKPEMVVDIPEADKIRELAALVRTIGALL